MYHKAPLRDYLLRAWAYLEGFTSLIPQTCRKIGLNFMQTSPRSPKFVSGYASGSEAFPVTPAMKNSLLLVVRSVCSVSYPKSTHVRREVNPYDRPNQPLKGHDAACVFEVRAKETTSSPRDAELYMLAAEVGQQNSLKYIGRAAPYNWHREILTEI